ncbi:MAG: hypothetical protein ACXU84_08070 [Xanthobacteraceae bacterium]
MQAAKLPDKKWQLAHYFYGEFSGVVQVPAASKASSTSFSVEVEQPELAALLMQPPL